MDIIGFILGALFFGSVIVLFVWCEIAKGRALEKENREFAEDIKHLPVDIQIKLWNTKYRHDADSDRL